MPEGAVAADSFAAALDVLRAHQLESSDRPPPLTYVGPSTGRRAAAAAPAGAAEDDGEDDGAGPLGGGPLTAALAAQRAGERSSVELVEASLAMIAALDGELAAMVEVHAEDARAEAAAADAARTAGRWLGPLHGLPLTVKDIIDVAGYPTRAGSLAYERHAERDAPAVARLRRAGAIIVGKASTHEFALGVTTPQTRNPFDHARIPGGSSGGSAVSVATGMALGSLGTDTRASIRVPAALTGVVGFKATHGAIPAAGIVSLSWTMDHVAPMAATIGDVSVMLGVLLDDPTVAVTGRMPAGLRVGLPEATLAGADEEVATIAVAAVEALVASTGARLLRTRQPSGGDLELAGAAGLIVSRCEAAAFHRSLGLDRFLYWAEVAAQLDAADEVRATDYLDAQRARGQLADKLLGCFDGVDLLAMPTTLTVAPLAADYEGHLMTLARNAIPWSFVGFPAVSIPVGRSDGLPVGLQLVAPPHGEGLLLAAGLAVERVVGLLPPVPIRR